MGVLASLVRAGDLKGATNCLSMLGLRQWFVLLSLGCRGLRFLKRPLVRIAARAASKCAYPVVFKCYLCSCRWGSSI